MTSPAASPQKPAITANSTASPARLPSAQPTPTHAAQQPAAQTVHCKWQCALREHPVMTTGTMSWTRVWRFSKLLLQTGC